MFSKTLFQLSVLVLLTLVSSGIVTDNIYEEINYSDLHPCGSTWCSPLPCRDAPQIGLGNCTQETLQCRSECMCFMKCDKKLLHLELCYNAHECYIRGPFLLHPGRRRSKSSKPNIKN